MAEERSITANDCGSVLPRLASWSAAELPSRPTCAGIHWTLTSFEEPIAHKTVLMEQNVQDLETSVGRGTRHIYLNITLPLTGCATGYY